MNRAKRMFQVFAIAGATLGPVAIAAADQAPTAVMAQKVSATATVEKVDTAKRELSLKDAKGDKFMVQVPESISRFDSIKKGDTINLDYYQSVALSLKKASEAGTTPSANEAVVAERSAGNLPGGAVGRQITASAQVMKVDPSENKVTIKGPSGEMDTINVSDPALQADLGKLKKGDRIKASYTEALAISVAPKEK